MRQDPRTDPRDGDVLYQVNGTRELHVEKGVFYRTSRKAVTIGRTYSFEAAHWLPTVSVGHKCRNMHGHRYEIEVVAHGPITKTGMVIDFAELDELVQPLISDLDHTTLNNCVALEVPTVEVIANYILYRLPLLVSSVKVWESARSWAMAER